MTEQLRHVNTHDVIQIAPGSDVKPMFYGKFALVYEVRNWGVKAYIDTFQGQAHLRLPWGTFEVVGPAPFVPAPDKEVPA
jgi:hypothetical protein